MRRTRDLLVFVNFPTLKQSLWPLSYCAPLNLDLFYCFAWHESITPWLFPDAHKPEAAVSARGPWPDEEQLALQRQVRRRQPTTWDLLPYRWSPGADDQAEVRLSMLGSAHWLALVYISPYISMDCRASILTYIVLPCSKSEPNPSLKQEKTEFKLGIPIKSVVLTCKIFLARE